MELASLRPLQVHSSCYPSVDHSQMPYELNARGIRMVTNREDGRSDGKALDECDVAHSGMDGHNVGGL